MQDQLWKQIDLKISCRALKDKDVFSKSDPFVIVRIKNNQNNTWTKVGQTDVMKNNLNPDFKEAFSMRYMFEERQECHFEVLDYDESGKHEHLGECYATLGSIVGARNNTLINELTHKNKVIQKSKIIIVADSFRECNDIAYMEWIGVKLANTDGWFDKSDPFLRFMRLREDNTTFSLAHETERVMDCLNPVWKGAHFSVQKLCNGEMLRPIKVECWDWQKNDKHQFIGEFQITMDALLKGQREFQLVNPKRKSPGTLALKQFNYVRKPSFLEFIQGNTQLNMMLAIDFTASNGAVTQPQSLHYLNPNVMNQYQQTIHAVGNILLDYDFDKRVPCFGFGGVPHFPNLTSPQVSHCFPLSGHPNVIEAVGGVGEILGMYRNSLEHVSLSGPTYFGPIVKEGIRISEIFKQQGSRVYSVLLILTDGEIHDMGETINRIVYAADLPMSIIIIGVGSADFKNMEKLDGDAGLVNDQGKKSTRDLVQFVEFSKHAANPSQLVSQVLAEVPAQLVNYMYANGISPEAPQPVNRQNC